MIPNRKSLICLDYDANQKLIYQDKESNHNHNN